MSTSIIFMSCSSGLRGKLRSSRGWGSPGTTEVADQRAGCSFPGRPGWLHLFFLFVLCLAESA